MRIHPPISCLSNMVILHRFHESPTEIHAVEIPRSPLELHRRLDQHKAKHFFRDFFCPFYFQALKKPLFKGLTYFMVPVPRIELSAEHYHCSVLPLYYTCLLYTSPKAISGRTSYIRVRLEFLP